VLRKPPQRNVSLSAFAHTQSLLAIFSCMKILLLSLCLAITVRAAAQSVEANAYVPPRQSTVLATTFVDWNSLAPSPTSAGQVRHVFDNPTVAMDKLEVHITTLNPGMESHPIHRHPWEEILLIKDGDFELSINGRKQHAGPGAMVFLASNDPHNARNVGSRPATYYVLNFVTDLSHSASAKSAAEQAVTGKLASSVIDCNRLPSTPSGSRVVCVNSPTLTFLALESHITTLNVGQQTATNIIDSNDEIVVIKSGQVEVTVNGIASRMNEGSLLYWAPNDKRTLRNIGSTPTSYQVIRVTSAKSPKPIAN
jgi:quercetin dioxygenase-like cupin family protein